MVFLGVLVLLMAFLRAALGGPAGGEGRSVSGVVLIGPIPIAFFGRPPRALILLFTAFLVLSFIVVLLVLLGVIG